MRAFAALAAALLVGGCATATFNAPANAPLTTDVPASSGAPQGIVGENAIALSFSGGGLRAAAFSYGVLTALAEMKAGDADLLDDVAFVGSVSGGSLTAAYFGLHGREGLSRFRGEVLALDLESDLRRDPLLPWNLTRILGGGLNQNFAATLDERVFRGATFADLYRRGKPDVWINATDLYYRVAFPFIPQIFSLICSDITSYSVAEAVAASMAVPVVFAPTVLRTYPGECQRPLPRAFDAIRDDPDAPPLARAAEAAIRAHHESPTRFIKLADGGLSDNFGLSALILARLATGSPYAPLTAGDAVRARRLLFIEVDASRPPGGDWIARENGPAGAELAVAAIDAAVDSAARLAADAFSRMVREWEQAVIEYRCGLSPEEAHRLGAPADWNCADVRFSVTFLSMDRVSEPLRSELRAIPTRLTLDSRSIDLAIEGGRRAALELPRLREFLAERTGRPEAELRAHSFGRGATLREARASSRDPH